MKRRQEIEVKIDKLAFGGRGLAKVKDRVVFVDGGIPGDRAVVRISKIKSNYAEARIKELLEPSGLRQPAPCAHFGDCGGCKWQNLDYDHQLEFKKEQVVESLEHIGGLLPEIVHHTLPSPLVYGYRNKTEFSFTHNRWLVAEELNNPEIEKGFALGYHVPGAFDRVMHIEKCWLQDDTMNAILNFSQQYFEESGLSVFDLRSHVGQLRFLVLRKSFT
ncbi:MAG: TRAM domain-containing protein, partial [Calditrichia bacterium]